MDANIFLQLHNTREKLADITISIISAVNSRCQCSLTVNHITNEHFLCTSDQQVVLYRAQLSGHSDCARVLSYIQQWINGGQTSIVVQSNSINVDPYCPIEVASLTAQADCERSTAVTDSGSVEITDVGGGVGEGVGGAVGIVVLIGIIILAAVVVCMCIRRHKQNKLR